MKPYIATYSDASVRDGEGVGIGYVIQIESDCRSKGKLVKEGTDRLHAPWTTMEAEFIACIRAVKEARQCGPDRIEMHTDSTGLAKKIEYEDPLTDDGRYCTALQYYLRDYDEWEVHWIPREQNKKADRLAHSAFED